MNNSLSFIRHYGFVNFTKTSLKIVLRRISLLKFDYLIRRGRIKKPPFRYPDQQSIAAEILRRENMAFETNIRSIKERQLYTEEVKQILFEADAFCSNRFNILNSGWLNWESQGEIDWHTDRKSGHRFEQNIFYRSLSNRIRNQVRSDKKREADLKVPRELSRFHFLFGLYFAYIYTGESKYLIKIKDSIVSWIDHNPPYYGINWSNAMEASIRISNWTLIVFQLRETLLQDEAFISKFYVSLYQHNLFINHNLENLILLNNHYIADISGLVIANSLFPVFKNSASWLKKYAKKLRKELRQQIRLDGGDVESSTPYQRLVTELFFLPIYLSRSLGLGLFDGQDELILKNMSAFIVHTLKPGGRVIQFGDNDDGRLFKLFDRPSLDHSYMPCLSFGLFGDQNFAVTEKDFDILAYVFFGDKIARMYRHNQHSIYKIPSKNFRESGVYILRNEEVYLAVSCMPNGQNGYGVHTHNDKLSFELSFRDTDIIVDPGTFLYATDPVNRNLYRSTSYHNTISENYWEQNNFGEDVFRLRNDARVEVLQQADGYLACRHNGFLRKGGSIHQRNFKIEQNSVTITDSLQGNFTAQSFLHFAENLTLEREGNLIGVFNNEQAVCELHIHHADTIEISEYLYSPAYAVRVPCFKITTTFRNTLKTEFIYLS